MQNDDLLQLLSEQRKLINSRSKAARADKVPVVGKNTGYFLESAVNIYRPLSILEIGCGNGFSSYFIIKGMSSESKYTGIDLNSARLGEAKNFISSLFPSKSHTFIGGNALDIIPGLDGVFDMVFIDAAKFEYPLYLEAVRGRIKKGSIIIADNILCQDKVFEFDPGEHYRNSVEGIKKYLQMTGPSSGFDTVLLDIDDGLALSVKI